MQGKGRQRKGMQGKGSLKSDLAVKNDYGYEGIQSNERGRLGEEFEKFLITSLFHDPFSFLYLFFLHIIYPLLVVVQTQASKLMKCFQTSSGSETQYLYWYSVQNQYFITQFS